MAPASDIRPDPTTAAGDRRVRGSAPPSGHARRQPVAEPLSPTSVGTTASLAMALVGLLIFTIRNADGHTLEALRDSIPTYIAMAVTGLLVLTLGYASYRRALCNENATLHTPDSENDAFNAPDNRNGTLHTKVDEIDLRLTALIAGLDKTDEVEAAVEGRLPEPGLAGPADSEAAAAPS